MRLVLLVSFMGLAVVARPASANCSHHTSGGGSSGSGSGSGGTTKPSGPDWNGTCVRWERISDPNDAGPDDGGNSTGLEIAPGDGPSDGGTNGLICVETVSYGPQYGCGCEVASAAVGASLLALIRIVRKRSRR